MADDMESSLDGKFTKLEDTLSVLDPPKCIFEEGNIQSKSTFEAPFRKIDGDAVFSYLNSFSQVRIIFSSVQKAREVMDILCGTSHMDATLKLKYTEYIQLGSSNLKLPDQKQLFLISPPSTPPVGWVQIQESEPSQPNVEEMLHALQIASCAPSEPVQVHPGCHETPSIVLHAPDMEDDDDDNGSEEESVHGRPSGMKISSCPPQLVHTARPP